MLAEMIQAVIRKTLAVDYSHLQLPGVVLVRIESARKLDSYEIKELTLTNEDEGKSCRGHIEANWYEYKLTVLDRFGSPDPAFPAIPEIKSRKQLPQGATAAAALLYGELLPVLIGEVRL